MNTQDLLDRYFETAFSAPNGIKRLRELILTLAMQGKLVPQDPSDQSARELLKEIEAEKHALIQAGKIKKQKPLPEITPEEIPYELPENWEWVRLGNIGDAQTGTTPPRNDVKNFGNFIPFINPGDIKENSINYSANGLSEIGLTKGRLIRKNSILMVCIGGSIGKHAINNIDVTCNQQINTITPFIDEFYAFLFYAMKSVLFQSLVISQAGGSATPIINKQKWSQIPIPLPPLAQQKRIVEKCDRLMAQCDQLEQLQREREQKRILIHTAAREKLLKASDQETFGQAWDFIKENFGDLYAVKENVTSLRQAIWQLAVMGKLVPQDPNDPPASELLKEISAEKQLLIKEGKIKMQKPLPEIIVDEIPYELPETWQWTKSENISSTIVDCPHSTPKFISEGIICLDTNSFKNGMIIKDKLRFVSEETYLDRIKRLIPQENDLVFAREGSVGESVIIPPGMKCCLGQRVMLFRPQKILPNYLQLSLSNLSFLSRLLDLHKGIGAKHVNVGDMRNALIPLPPLSEQHRIVAKVDALMTLCDRLENQIDQQTTKQTQLLESVMAGV